MRGTDCGVRRPPFRFFITNTIADEGEFEKQLFVWEVTPCFAKNERGNLCIFSFSSFLLLIFTRRME